MSIHEYRARTAHDTRIRDAVARAAAPGLLNLIESGHRLNDPRGISYRSMNDHEVFEPVRIIADYRHLMRTHNRHEYDRATRALACGHGYTLMDSCPACDNNEPADPDALPLIALHPAPEHDDED